MLATSYPDGMGLRRITVVLDQRVIGYRGKAQSAYNLMAGVGSQLCFDPTLTEAKDKVVLDVIAEQKNVPALLALIGTVEGIGTGAGSRVAIASLLAVVPPLGSDDSHLHGDLAEPLSVPSSVQRQASDVREAMTRGTRQRMSIHEIFQSIDSSSHLTFDYLAMTAAAAAIAAAGLVQDSSVTVVASMLLSPLMSPILCLTYGAAVGHSEMLRRGVRNESAGVLVALLVGLATGSVLAPFFGPQEWSSDLPPEAWSRLSGSNITWPYELDSEQILSRGSPQSLIGGTLVAVPSGFGVVLAISGGGANALVGVAIAAALLPPVVNCGLCLALATWWQFFDPQADWARDIALALREEVATVFAQRTPLPTLNGTSSAATVDAAVVSPAPLLPSGAVAAAPRIGGGSVQQRATRRALRALATAATAAAAAAAPAAAAPAAGLSNAEAAVQYSTSYAPGLQEVRHEVVVEDPVFADSLHVQTFKALAALADPGGLQQTERPIRHPYVVVAVHGVWSFVLFVINLFSIVAIGSATFWLKGVSRNAPDRPLNFRQENLRRKDAVRGMWREAYGYAARQARINRMARFSGMGVSAVDGGSAKHIGQMLSTLRGQLAEPQQRLTDASKSGRPARGEELL